MNEVFRIGTVYVATPVLQGLQQKLVIPVGRDGRNMQIALVDNLEMADVSVGGMCDREFARVTLEMGDYTFSSACEASVEEYAKVRQILGV